MIFELVLLVFNNNEIEFVKLRTTTQRLESEYNIHIERIF
jgi:hypothetical protein